MTAEQIKVLEELGFTSPQQREQGDWVCNLMIGEKYGKVYYGDNGWESYKRDLAKLKEVGL